MDRLSAVTRVLLRLALASGALAGCNERHEAPMPSSRYEAVKAVADSSSHWCDATFAGAARRLTLPTLAAARPGVALPALPKGKRVWVNLWATWCKPCLREMPLLLKWRDELRKDGVDVEILFLSLDEDADVLDTFLSQRKDIPPASVARAASQRDYEQWVKAYLKDPSTPIPIHLLGSSDGSLRCIRSGSLREGDFPAAREVLRAARSESVIGP
jgi:thiol-disulfide isomerase/thioredoxin